MIHWLDQPLPCPKCQTPTLPARVVAEGATTTLYLRCLSCGLRWEVERPSGDKETIPPVT
jgi:hypothetical protein